MNPFQMTCVRLIRHSGQLSHFDGPRIVYADLGPVYTKRQSQYCDNYNASDSVHIENNGVTGATPLLPTARGGNVSQVSVCPQLV